MVPAVIVWWDHFRRPGPEWRIGSIHLVVLLPALVRGVCSPYRENLAPIFLIPLIAALFAGKRPSLAKVGARRPGLFAAAQHRCQLLPPD